MKFRLVWLFPVIIFFNLYGQVVTTDPQFPTENDSFTIIFDATKAQNNSLVGYSGDLYVHTGLITDKGNWRYVIESWGNNATQPKLDRKGDNLYHLKIENIRNFYPIGSANEKILGINLVFRSANSSKQTEDLSIPIYMAGPNVKIISPDSPSFVNLNESVNLKATGSNADSISLFINNSRVASSTSDSVKFSYLANSIGKKNIKVIAYNVTGNVSDSTYIVVKASNNVSDLPAGVEYGINYIDASTVTLSLYGNGKEFVYVIGDFNNWEPDENYQMNITPDKTTYWITLSNLEVGKEYTFQYYIDGELKLADPYTDKVLDPWNDKYITSSTYPNLKNYPEGKTDGIVSTFQTNQTNYSWEVTSFNKPDKEKLVIYELHVRDFIAEHSYKALIDSLDYFSRLGVNAIELMPINEFEGNSSWGYNPSFLFAPDKYYGPKNYLKQFIDECHKRGIAVLMDIVLNHSYGLSPFVQMYFESGKPAANNPWFNVNHNLENTDAHWGYDFNHESIHTQQLVDRITKYWLTEYNFDGFRFDFTKGFGNNWKSKTADSWASLYDADRIRLLKRMTDKIWESDPNAYVIFEHLAENSEEKELADYGILLWGNMNHNYNEASMGYNESNKSDLSYGLYSKKGWSQPNLITYMESHDEERLMYKNMKYGNSNTNNDYNIKNTKTALARQMLVSAFFYTLPGPKMLWQFGELGYDYSIDFNGRVGEKPIKWDYYQNKDRKNLYKVTSGLIKLKTKHEIFNTTDFSYSLNSAVKRINLNSDTLNITVIGNFDVNVKSTDPNFQKSGWWYDYFSRDSIYVTDVNHNIDLTAGEFRLYTDKKIGSDDSVIYTDIEDLTNELVESYGLTQNYPNPFNPSTTFKYQIPEESKVTVRIYNSIGQVVKTFENSVKTKGVYKVVWNGENDFGQKVSSGVYFYQLITEEYTQTKKMILMK